MTKYYVVIDGKGKTPMIYLDWPETQDKVIGYPNAKFKSFSDLKLALQYISENPTKNYDEIRDNLSKIGIIYPESFASKKSGNEVQENNLILSNNLVAYVDGSYNKNLHMYSYGIVLIKNETLIKTLNGKGDGSAADMRQIYGELMGVMKSIEYAIENNESEIIIYYDYTGIENWANGSWQRKNNHTEKYYDFIQEKKEKIKIHFKKVKAHSGDKYNDMADALAKQALGIKVK